MANEHPFQTLFETLGRLPSAHADLVNRQAYQALHDVLSVPLEKTGRCILLRAPRAGHGKTHMLSRMQHHLGASHEFIALHAGLGSRIDASSVTDDTLRRLLRPLPAAGGLCVLDLLTRRLFSLALQPLVASGEVPCQDREGALTALRTRPVETFDFHHPNAVTAHWARENFEILGQRLSMEIAQRGGLPVREVAFWVDTLFHFAATPVDHSARMRGLADAIHLGDPAEGVRMDRLVALLGMVAMLVRVVLVADDLEGFSSDETAALGLAAFLGSLRQSVDRLDVIISLNQDVWDSAFVPRLTGGLADRLSEVLIELGPLNDSEMLALLESRVPGLGSRVLERVDRGSAGTHARGVIRAAGVAWMKASEVPPTPQSGYSPVISAVSPVVVPPHFVEEMVKPVSVPVDAPVPESPNDVPAPEVEIEEIPTVETVSPTAVPALDDEAPVVEEIHPHVPAPEVMEVTTTGISEEESVQVHDNTAAVEPEPVEEPAPVVMASPFSVASPIMDAPSVPAQDWKAPAAEVEPPIVPVTETPEPAPVVMASPFSVATPIMDAPSVPAQDWKAAAAAVEPAIVPVTEAPEPVVVWNTPAASPFQAAPAVPEYQAAPAVPEYQAAPAVPEYQAAPAVPEYQAAPAFQAAPAVVEVPVSVPSPEPVVAPVTPVQAKPQDTDRVDELLRQFRERYGRGNS